MRGRFSFKTLRGPAQAGAFALEDGLEEGPFFSTPLALGTSESADGHNGGAFAIFETKFLASSNCCWLTVEIFDAWGLKVGSSVHHEDLGLEAQGAGPARVIAARVVLYVAYRPVNV
jgi:hypothetical protein